MTSNPFEPERIVLIDAPGPEEEDHFELPDHRHHCRLRLRGPGRPDPAARSAPSYGALSISDLLTAVLLFGQFARSLKSLLVLGCAYLFDVFIIVPHALSFPGVLGLNSVCGARLYIGSGLSLRRALYTNRYKQTAIY